MRFTYFQNICLSLLLFLLAISCQNDEFSGKEGEELVKTYCQSCHELVLPEMLPRSTWEDHVLPRMGALYGIYSDELPREELLGKGLDRKYYESINYYPEKQRISDNHWNAIKQYILKNAPDSLKPFKEVKALDTLLPTFTPGYSSYKLSPPSVSYVEIKHGNLYLGDINTQGLYQYSSNLVLQKAARVGKGLVSFLDTKQEAYATVMGSFSPTEEASGYVLALPKYEGGVTRKIIDSLVRPVHCSFGDINGDKRTDLLICEFGKYHGQLAWHELTEKGDFVTHPIKSVPGATRAYMKDEDKDGDIDIFALFGQGDEGIFYFENNGKGQFKEKKILSFSATYGSSFFDFIDWNGDGEDDIIYTNGDNADYSPILKPYHGIWVFVKENGSYKEELFLPLNGAYKAIPIDFDMDGDLDIAAISFFPDYKNRPLESFVYFQNQGNNEFKSFTFPQADYGRWISMDAGDIDQDGDQDLVLGSLTFEVPGNTQIVEKWVKNGLPFLFLENNTK
ncbi:MAG: VCBS repeat-containing protein [Bacteroidia bacterium]|nr:VCBS repeat-containing protein [Bacteroidia bacterium]